MGSEGFKGGDDDTEEAPDLQRGILGWEGSSSSSVRFLSSESGQNGELFGE
jgi:hypothetical protein